MREWREGGLPLNAGMGCAVAFTCPCGRPKIHGDRTSVAYSTHAVVTKRKHSASETRGTPKDKKEHTFLLSATKCIS